MVDVESKRTLEHVLETLLGFDEGEAVDLLEHLFTIDDDNDLSEYMAQLLGDETPEMVDFVHSMSRYRRGESITTTAKNHDEDDQKASSKKAEIDASSRDNFALDSFRAMAIEANGKGSKKSLSRKSSKKNQGIKSRVPPPKNVNSRKQPTSSANQSTLDRVENLTSSSVRVENPAGQQQRNQQESEKSHPVRGKPKVVCGCFGTKYKALTNCLYCGRIICEAEGYDFCPFCGFMVEPPTGGNGKAFLQKERLLRFDRDFARRTKVFDDQADYQAPSTWMTEDEKKEAEENQLRHLESLKRPKQMLKIAI